LIIVDCLPSPRQSYRKGRIRITTSSFGIQELPHVSSAKFHIFEA
jgi:hypothetical protein